MVTRPPLPHSTLETRALRPPVPTPQTNASTARPVENTHDPRPLADLGILAAHNERHERPRRLRRAAPTLLPRALPRRRYEHRSRDAALCVCAGAVGGGGVKTHTSVIMTFIIFVTSVRTICYSVTFLTVMQTHFRI